MVEFGHIDALVFPTVRVNSSGFIRLTTGFINLHFTRGGESCFTQGFWEIIPGQKGAILKMVNGSGKSFSLHEFPEEFRKYAMDAVVAATTNVSKWYDVISTEPKSIAW
jgi:hypothetical protein